MSGFRITKYDPKLRDERGRFLASDWTSISDIGGEFSFGRFDLSQYLKIEGDYVESVRRLIAAANVKEMKIVAREVREVGVWIPDAIKNETRYFYSNAESKNWVAGGDLAWVIKLCLRECLWCRLEGGGNTYVHFGYDYYMYFGTSYENFAVPDLPYGIYAEPFDSPYLEE